MKYYNGDKTLNIKDKDGNVPELFLITSTRGTGKTTYFYTYFLKKWLEDKEQFCLFIRYKSELDLFTPAIFSEVLEFNHWEDLEILFSPIGGKSAFCTRIKINGETAGFIVPLNSVENVKKSSHMFRDVKRIMFDEFQTESNRYAPSEVTKFRSLHSSMARGHGEMHRYLPVYMLSNPVTVLNPYFIELDIADKITNETKIYKGSGFIVENFWSDDIKIAAETAGITKAFAGSAYSDYLVSGKYLNDNSAFIEKMTGPNKYLATLVYNGKHFAIRYFHKENKLYVDRRVDKSFHQVMAFNSSDHSSTSYLARSTDPFSVQIRMYFDRGQIAFSDQEAKTAIVKYIC